MKQQFRIGNGYDLHQLVKDRKLILGGIHIPYHLGLLGQSDADALIHSIMDALLGALSLGDIGKYFPPNDVQYKDICSMKLLKQVKKMIDEQNYSISNIDNVIQAEKPKLLDFVGPMKQNLAKILDLEINQISIKATTLEGLGPIGENKAIAVHSVVLLVKN